MSDFYNESGWMGGKKEDSPTPKSIYNYDYGSSSSYYSRSFSSGLGWGYNRFMDSIPTFKFNPSLSDEIKLFEVLQKAINDTKVLVDILNFPKPIELVVLPDEYKEGVNIFLPTTVMDKTSLSDSEKIFIINGLGLHEAAHLKYTDRRSFNKFLKTVKEKSSTPIFKLASLFINLVEDFRVNSKLLQDRTGLKVFIEKLDEFKYNEVKNSLSDTRDELYNDFILSIISLISFPNKIDKSKLDSFSKVEYMQSALNSISDLIKTTVPKSTIDSCNLGWKCALTLEDIIKEDILKEAGAKSKVKGKGEADGSEGSEGGKSGDVSSKLEGKLGSVYRKVSKAFKGSFSYSEFDPDSAKQVELNSTTNSSIKKEDSRLQELLTGKAMVGSTKNAIFEKLSNSNVATSEYLSIKERISKYVPIIKKSVKLSDKNYEYVISGCRSGLLDTNKLAEAYQGVPQVYVRKGVVTTNKTAVCVLIDESGSMWGRNKIIVAQEAAILINEALGNLPGVDLYIYGHTADIKSSNETVVRIYKEGNKTPKTDKYLLGNISNNYLCQNRDGNAIREVTGRVRNFTKSKCFLFILSDGEPGACGYGGQKAREDVKEAVINAEKNNFEVVQVTIDHIDKEKCEEMGFKNSINLDNDLSNFPERLAKIIKTAVLKDKETKISN